MDLYIPVAISCFIVAGLAAGFLAGIAFSQQDALVKQADFSAMLNRAERLLTRRNEISTAMAYDLRRFVDITEEMTKAEQPKAQTTSGA